MCRPPPARASATRRNILVPTFWAADASFSPGSQEARAISSPPNQQVLHRATDHERKNDDEHEDQNNALQRAAPGRSLRRERYRRPAPEESQHIELHRYMQCNQALQRALHLPDFLRNHGRVRERPRAGEAAALISVASLQTAGVPCPLHRSLGCARDFTCGLNPRKWAASARSARGIDRW